MLKDYSPITQALLGTLFTWALTAAGAALVIVIRGQQVSFISLFPSLFSSISIAFFLVAYIALRIHCCMNQNYILSILTYLTKHLLTLSGFVVYSSRELHRFENIRLPLSVFKHFERSEEHVFRDILRFTVPVEVPRHM